jgi:hypothetical protein
VRGSLQQKIVRGGNRNNHEHFFSKQESLGRCQGRNHIRGNRLAPPYRVNAFIRLGLQMNAVRRDTKSLRQCLAHFRKVRPQLRSLEDHYRIDMLNRKFLFAKQSRRMLQELHAVSAFPLWIGIRKMRANITQPRRAEKRVAKRMRHNIPVRMSRRPFVKKHFESTDNQFPSRFQAVQVVPDAAAHAHFLLRSRSR